MVIGHQTQSTRESKTPAQKARQSSHIGSGVPAQRTEAAVALQLARTAPASLQPADVLALQRAAGNQAVQRLLAPALARPAQGVPAVQLKPQATNGQVTHVTSAPAGIIQRVGIDVKRRNREAYRQEIKEAITETLTDYKPEEQAILFNHVLEMPAAFPPPESPLYDQLFDKSEGEFAKGTMLRQFKVITPILQNEGLLHQMLVAEVQRKEWRAKYAKQRRSPINQGQVLATYYKGKNEEEVGGICFAASIHWLSEVKKKPKYSAGDAVKFIKSEEGIRTLIEIQKAHHQFVESEKTKSSMLRKGGGLLPGKLNELGLNATEEWGVQGELSNLTPLFGWLNQKREQLAGDNSELRFILTLHAGVEGAAGHAIAFQLRRKGTGKSMVLQLNFLDVNDTVFKMKKMPWGNVGAWAKLEEAITSYLQGYYEYKSWSVTSYL